MSSKTTLMAAAELANVITRIGKDNASLANRIQAAAVECIGQSIVHRNITPAQQLYDNLGTSQRRDSLVAYFEKFGNIAWDKTNKKIVFFDVEKITDGKTVLAWTEDYVDVVAGSKWDAAKKQSEPVSQYDVSTEVAKFIATMEKRAERGASLAHDDLLVVLKNAVASYNFKDYVRTSFVPLKEEMDEIERVRMAAARQAAEAQK